MSKVKLSVYVPTELHRQAKYAAIERGTTIQHVVEDALNQSFDPTRSTTHELKPREVNMAQTQLKNILNSGNDDLINSCLACLRGGHAILQIAAKSTTTCPAPDGGQTQSEQIPVESQNAVPHTQRTRKDRMIA